MATQLLRIKFAIIIIVSAFTFSCSKNDVISEFKQIPESGWHKDSIYDFTLPIKDTQALYNVYVNVRNTDSYSYQNFWIFINRTSPDGIITKDTIECYLADQRGKWLGSGVGSIKEMPILYQQKVSFSKPGNYQFHIVHGMRDTLLMGINDIGLRVEKAAVENEN